MTEQKLCIICKKPHSSNNKICNPCLNHKKQRRVNRIKRDTGFTPEYHRMIEQAVRFLFGEEKPKSVTNREWVKNNRQRVREHNRNYRLRIKLKKAKSNENTRAG